MSYPLFAQDDLKYDRSSLSVLMIYHNEDEFGLDIKTAFEAMPFPDKYDKHDIGVTYINNPGLVKAQFGKKLTSNDVIKNAKTLETILNNGHVANYLIARWFGLYDNNVCNVDLIKERGQYNATEIDVAIANQSARGLAMLSDAGEQLIGNTYVLINDMTYVTAEERASVAKGVLLTLGAIADGLLGNNNRTFTSLANTGGQIADSFTGFSVKNHSYLFRLEWNDDIAAIFYNEYYITEPNPAKISKFLGDSRFKVKYVAHEFEFGEKTTLKGNYNRHDLVKMICTRSIDKNIAALQLQYEDFKVKAPVYDVVLQGKHPEIAVKIGLKEGVNAKSKYQVIRKEINPKTNKTSYKYVATVKPVKGKIWDNRYMAAKERERGSNLSYTTFRKKTGGEILPGMLVIQGKYSKAAKDSKNKKSK